MAINTKNIKGLLKEMQMVINIERHQLRIITSQVGRQGLFRITVEAAESR
jgi:hypothetical protein